MMSISDHSKWASGKSLVILGGGGHARDIASMVVQGGREACTNSSLSLLGYVSPDRGDESAWARLGVVWLGDDSALKGLAKDTGFVVGIGDGSLRSRLSLLAQRAGLRPIAIVAPTAEVGADVLLEPGAVVFPGAIVTTNVRVGQHTHINVAASVSHDCVLGAFVTVNPGARLCGWVSVGESSMVGAGAVVNPRVRLGVGVRVGAGAAVINDVKDQSTVVGVPARPMLDN